MLKVKNVTKYYGEETVLNKISFTLEREHKVALVGFNGTGKTTLLKILSGEVMPEIGQINFNKNIVVGSLPQDPDMYNNTNVLSFIEEYVGESDELFYRNIEIMFAGFGLDSNIKKNNIGDLSSGQKTKVFLTALLLKKVDLMLLDEPTNNLDLPALIWLEDFLQKTKSAFIVVSHDKTFLDNVVNKIYEIDWKERSLEISNGKYSNYLIRRAKERKRQNLDHIIQSVDIKRLRNLAKTKEEHALKGAKHLTGDNDHMLQGYYRDKANDSFHDAKIINNRLRRMDIIKKPNDRKPFNIEINPEEVKESRDIKISNLVCGYKDEKGDFKIGPINLDIPFGTKICILGLNGSGKSTLLKTLNDVISPLSGNIEIGSGVKIGNLMQEHESLERKTTVLDFMTERIAEEKEVIQEHLQSFGFPAEQMKTKIYNLSPGGRARLLLAYFSADNVNTLILDEPTNHLDMEAEEALERTMMQFEGTVIVATHDRFFVEKIIDGAVGSLYVLADGVLNKINKFKEYVEEMEEKSKKLMRMLKE